MAAIGLVCGVTMVLKVADKRIYALTCFIPLAYLYITVNVAGYWMIKMYTGIQQLQALIC